MGLTPAVYYTFLVTAENDVSSQDSNVNVRSANVTATTEKGGTQVIVILAKNVIVALLSLVITQPIGYDHLNLVAEHEIFQNYH